MPYPETAEGFVIEDTKNWSTFKKQEVCNQNTFVLCDTPFA